MASHTVINRTKQLTIVPLNDGTTVHLAPGEQVPVDASLLSGNSKAKKLVERKVLELTPPLPEMEMSRPVEAKAAAAEERGESTPVGGPAEPEAAAEPDDDESPGRRKRPGSRR